MQLHLWRSIRHSSNRWGRKDQGVSKSLATKFTTQSTLLIPLYLNEYELNRQNPRPIRIPSIRILFSTQTSWLTTIAGKKRFCPRQGFRSLVHTLVLHNCARSYSAPRFFAQPLAAGKSGGDCLT